MDQTDYDKLMADASERRDNIAAKEGTSIYDELMRKDDEEQNQQLMNSLFAVGGINPDTAAEAQKLGYELGVGPDVARRNMDEVRKQAKLRQIEQYKLTAQSPILARQLMDPEFAAIAHDDIPNLKSTGDIFQWFSSIPKDVTEQWEAGNLEYQLGMLGNLASLGKATPEDFREIKDIQTKLKTLSSEASFLGGASRILGQMSNTLPDAMAAGVVTGVGTGTIAAAAGPASPITVPAGFVSGFTLGSTYKMAEQAQKMEAGYAYLDMIEGGADKNVSMWVSQGVGLINAAAEMTGVSVVAAPFKRALNRAIGQELTKALVRPTVARAVTGVVKTYGGSILAESGTEAFQEFVSFMGEDLARVLSPGELEAKITTPEGQKELATRITDVFVKTAMGMAVLGVPGTVVQFNSDVRRANQATRTGEFFDALSKNATEARVRQRSPGAYEQFIAAQAKGGPAENIYVDGAVLVDVLRQSGMTDQELNAVLPEVAGQLAVAAQTGGDVVIPTAKFAARIAGTDLGNAMTPHLRLDPEAMSVAEAQQFSTQMEQMKAEAKAVLDQKRESDEAFVESANEVRTTLFEQIKATGIYTPEQARNAATLQAATYTMLANQLKMTPSEVYALMPYKQVAGQAQAGTLSQGSSSLEQVTSAWDAAGISHDVSEKNGVITLSKIVVPREARGEGSGTAAMQALVDYADRTGQSIKLDASSQMGGDKARLVEFYKRFGFTTDKRTAPASATWKDTAMTREPAGARTLSQSAAVTVTVADSRYKDLSPAEARTAAERDLSKGLRGSYTNADTGWPIEVSKKSIRESLHGSGSKVRAEIVSNLPALLERAVLVESHQDAKKRPGVSSIHRFYAPFQLDGRLNRVKLTVREFTDGSKRHYAVDYVETSGSDVSKVFPGQSTEEADRATGTPSDPSVDIDAFLGDLKAPRGTLEQGPRGGYSPKQLTTLLNESSDVSTVMHEFSHFYLDVLTRLMSNPAATAQMKADLQALVEFGGATMDEWTGWTAEYEATGKIPDGMRKVHEAVAYNTEIYLFEGKAPSLELQGVFERFVRWMKQVYTNIRDQLNAAYREEFGVDLPVLTGEVRQVFDRMLASEDEIKQAEAVRNMAPMFGTQAESGMSDPEWAAYQAMLEEARDAAVTDLTRASLRQMQWLSNARGRLLAQMQRQHKARRKEIREEVSEEMRKRPLYQAIEFLKRGRIDGVDVEYPVKLSIEEIEAMYGENPIVGLIKKTLGFGKFGMLASENAMHPDQVAEMFGFKSGDAMVRELLAAPSLREAINAETDARMLAENGDMNTPEAREAAIEAALHSEARARFVAVELRFLEKATQPVRVMLKAAQQVAREAISKKVIKEIRPKEYSAAEARAAKKANEAMKAGDSKGAARAKQAQLIQNQLAAEAVAARDEIDAALSSFRNLFKADKRIARGRNIDLVNAARSILAAYGIGKADKSPAEYTQQLRAYNPELYAELEPLILRASASAKPYDTLTMDEFRLMRDAVDALWFQARRDNQIMVDGRKLALESVVKDLNGRLVEIGIPETIPGEKEAVGKRDKLVRSFYNAKAITRRVEHWANATDGAAGTGPFTKYIWRPMRKALDEYRAKRNVYVKRYVELLEKVNLPVAKIAAPELGYTFGNANNGLGKAELLGALMHTGNESNLRKLLIGRGWARELGDGTLDTSRWDAFRQRMINEGHITKEDYDFVQAVWDLNEELKPQAQKAHHDLFGYYFKEVEAKPVTTPFGVYRGGYVPAKTDPDMVRDAQVHQKMEDMESDFRNSMPSTGMGFTKGRVEYNKPLSLDVRLIAKHIDDVIRFAHVQPVVKDVLRIIREREFADNLTRIDPAAIEGMLLPWLNRAARQITTEAGKHKSIDRFWSAVRSRTGIGIMFANITNALQQVTGYFPALLKVKPSYLKGALAQYMGGLQKMTEDVADMSPFMADRLHNQVFDLQDTMNDLLLNPTRYNKIQKWASQHGYFLQQAFQNQVDVVTWTATFNQTLAELGADKTDAEAVREAVARADGNVRMTQSSLLPEDVAGYEATTPFFKTLIQFSGYFNMLANINADEYIKVFRDLGWRGNKGKLFMIYLLGFGLPMLVSDAIVRTVGGQWDDDDDDGYLDVFMSWFFGSQFRGAAAMVPAFGSGIATVPNFFNNKPYDDRMTSSPSVATLEAVTKGLFDTVVNVVDSDKEVTGKNVRDVLTLVSLVTGIPVTVLGRPIGYQIDVSRDKIEPTSGLDYARGLITGKASEASRP